MPRFEDYHQATPLFSFIISLFASSFGMTKFFLNGPISFLPKRSPLNGLLSLPFFCLCILNTMFGFRIISIESAFFTSYVKQSFNRTTYIWQTKSIEPIILPQYRLLGYLAPCMLSLLVNGLRLFFTTKGLRHYLLKYPQFVVGSCFTPFMFEGQKLPNSENRCTIRIWKLGTFINALYIGCLPQVLLLITDFCKGVYSWDFISKDLGDQSEPKLRMDQSRWISENNDALFKSPYGNSIFAVTSSLFFFLLILTFFCTNLLFKHCGTHCKFLYCICLPCPDPCIYYSDPNPPTQSNEIDQTINVNQPIEEPHTEIHLHKNQGYRRKLQVGHPNSSDEHISLQVNLTLCSNRTY